MATLEDLSSPRFCILSADTGVSYLKKLRIDKQMAVQLLAGPLLSITKNEAARHVATRLGPKGIMLKERSQAQKGTCDS